METTNKFEVHEVLTQYDRIIKNLFKEFQTGYSHKNKGAIKDLFD